MLKFGSGLHVGLTRQSKKNQDAICVSGKFTRMPIMILADGMGGYEGGEIASRIVINTVKSEYRKRNIQTPVVDILFSSILESHRKIIRKGYENAKLSKMGSTIVTIAIDKTLNKIHIANVGDSRAYMINKDEIRIISYDHSEVADLRRAGAISEEDASNYFRKNVLTMSLSARRPVSSIKPYTETLDFPKDTILLLCSDGLWGPVPETLIHLAALEFEPQQAAEKLIKLANINGGPDNISIIIARRSGDWKRYKKFYSRDLDDTG